MNLNPSYRVYEIDSNSKVVKDYVQYGFDIIEANKNKERGPNWIQRYRASELFKVKYISDYDGVLKYFIDIKNRKIEFNEYLNAFFSYGPQYEEFKQNKSNNNLLIYLFLFRI